MDASFREANLTIHNERVETIAVSVGSELCFMTPKGVVAKDEVYKGIGLVEVDLNNLEFAKGWGLREIEIIKCPTRRKANGKTKKWIDWVFREMSGRLTLNSIKCNPWFCPGWEGKNINEG